MNSIVLNLFNSEALKSDFKLSSKDFQRITSNWIRHAKTRDENRIARANNEQIDDDTDSTGSSEHEEDGELE